MTALERRGRAHAQRMCAQCHAIGRTGRSPLAAALPLRNLDRKFDLDGFAERLREGLMSSHRDMPLFRFTRDDARAMVAYLRAIQGR